MSTIPVKSLKIVCALLLVLAVTVKAGNPFKTQNDPAEKKKTINRSFTVSSSDKLSVENSFGTVDIKTWNKNEFKVDITITAKGSSDEQTQRLLDAIEVKESQSGGVYSFKTEVNTKGGHHSKNDKEKHGKDNQEFQIDYAVYMPASNPLNAENSFGKLLVGDMNGATTLTNKFGEMNAGNISNNTSISSEFGEATVAGVNGGKITVKFGKLTIGSIGGDVKVVSEYAEAVFNLNNNLSGLNLINSFGAARINLSADMNASITAECSFGEISNTTSFPLKKIVDEDNRYSLDKHYEGTTGNGSVKIIIKSNFGDVRLMNPGDKDDSPKNKKKHKNDDDDDV